MSLSIAEIPSGIGYAEFLDWLDEDIHAEWVRGEVVVKGSVSLRHQCVMAFLLVVLKLFVEPRRLGEVIPLFHMKTAPHLPGREPDILFVSNGRSEIAKHTFVDGAADLVVEIISPESRIRDTVEKFAEYEDGGVKEYWLIDPETETARFFCLDHGTFALIDTENNVFDSKVLPGFWLSVTWLWSTPTILDVLDAWNTDGGSTTNQ